MCYAFYKITTLTSILVYCDFHLAGNNQRNREFDLDQDMDGIQDDLEHIEESALCPGGRILRLNVSATERIPQ